MTTPTTTLPVLFTTGIHSARPAASAVGAGGLYSCTTHSLVYQTDGASWTTWATLSGTGLSDPMTTRGDIIYRDSSNVTNRLAIPAAGKVLGRSGSDLGAVYPPGYEFDYVQITSPVTLAGTSEGTATSVVAGSSVAYDGSTVVMIEFYSPRIDMGSASTVILLLYEDSTLLGRFGTSTVTTIQWPVHSRLRRTPSNASHTYTVKGFSNTSNAIVSPGTGGTGNDLAAFIRVVKVS